MTDHDRHLEVLPSRGAPTPDERMERRAATDELYKAVRAEGNILIVAARDPDDPRITIVLSEAPAWAPSGELHRAQDDFGRLGAYFTEHGIDAEIDEAIPDPMTITLAGAADARRLTALIARPTPPLDLAVDRLTQAFARAGIHGSSKGLTVLDPDNAWRLYTVLTAEPTVSTLTPLTGDHHDPHALGEQVLAALRRVCGSTMQFEVIPWCEDCARPDLLRFVLGSDPAPYDRLAAHIERHRASGPPTDGTP
ncbi:hypothetical protein ACIQF5_21110 [Streptomyces goshikiensis]|uniref:hypothetical protein n=1 Tax=Streptomyces goshikiensis TaxID=1942 RepID=UPI00380889C2